MLQVGMGGGGGDLLKKELRNPIKHALSFNMLLLAFASKIHKTL